MHVLHQGRAEYTLIYPTNPPRVEKHVRPRSGVSILFSANAIWLTYVRIQVMGPNIEAGETLQLLVGTGVWKKSKLLDEDVAAARSHLIPTSSSSSCC